MSENKKVEIYESNLNAAYKVANENGGDERMIRLLDALTDKTATEDNCPKPSLDDYKTIQSYEDACEALGENPILSEDREKALCAKFLDHWDYRQDMPKHIIALMKLETISRALWGRNFQPKPDGKGSQILWYPWFALYTQEEVNGMDEDRRGALLAAGANYGAAAGFGCLSTDFAPRMRMRTLGSACARKRRRKQSISAKSLSSSGLNTTSSISLLVITSNKNGYVD